MSQIFSSVYLKRGSLDVRNLVHHPRPYGTDIGEKSYLFDKGVVGSPNGWLQSFDLGKGPWQEPVPLDGEGSPSSVGKSFDISLFPGERSYTLSGLPEV